jgi:Domain of unknown function (DUF4926)
MIDELDLVVLKRDLPKERLAAGDVGTVVLVHQQGAGYEVEFTTLSGDTVAVVTLDASDVRPVAAREIVHARAVSLRHIRVRHQAEPRFTTSECDKVAGYAIED